MEESNCLLYTLRGFLNVPQWVLGSGFKKEKKRKRIHHQAKLLPCHIIMNDRIMCLILVMCDPSVIWILHHWTYIKWAIIWKCGKHFPSFTIKTEEGETNCLSFLQISWVFLEKHYICVHRASGYEAAVSSSHQGHPWPLVSRLPLIHSRPQGVKRRKHPIYGFKESIIAPCQSLGQTGESAGEGKQIPNHMTLRSSTGKLTDIWTKGCPRGAHACRVIHRQRWQLFLSLLPAAVREWLGYLQRTSFLSWKLSGGVEEHARKRNPWG